MSAHDEEGYIMASALAALFAMALVATAMVSVSGTALTRVKRMETAAQNRLAVESAIRIVGSQLAMDPRRRQLDLSSGTILVELGASRVYSIASWESARMDANLAPIDEIRETLDAARVGARRKSAILAGLRAAHVNGTPISLLDDLDLAPEDLRCAHHHLTTFGGLTEFVDAQSQAPISIGRPAAGARIRIEARPASGGIGRTAVLLMTGDVHDPYLILDWRQYRGDSDDPCKHAD